MGKTQRRSLETPGKSDHLTIDSIRLIKILRPHDVLYNTAHPRYHDRPFKDEIWDALCQQMFPKYKNYSATTRLQLNISLKKRWKTLRNCLSKQIKKYTVNGVYTRTNESAIQDELEFLMPFIKSSACEKPADDRAAAGYLQTSLYEIPDIDQQNLHHNQNQSLPITMANIEDHCDLTLSDDEIDTSQFLLKLEEQEKVLNCENNSDMTDENSRDTSENDNRRAAEEHQHLSSEHVSGETNQNRLGNKWFKDYCIVVPNIKEEDQNINSTTNSLPVTQQQRESIENMKISNVVSQLNSSNQEGPIDVASKRARFEAEELPTSSTAALAATTFDIQSKLIDLMAVMEARLISRDAQHAENPNNNDVDRMFLLSLVADLKQIPASKKMLVKAEITAAIARGMT